MVVGAVWGSGTTLIEVSFSEPIADAGSLDVSNWSFLPFSLSSITAVVASEGVVRVFLGEPPAGVSSISYSPPPFDVIGELSGLGAEAFTDFPVMTV